MSLQLQLIMVRTRIHKISSLSRQLEDEVVLVVAGAAPQVPQEVAEEVEEPVEAAYRKRV